MASGWRRLMAEPAILPRGRQRQTKRRTRVLVVVGTIATFATGVSAEVAIRGPHDSRAGSSFSAGGEVRQEYEWFDNEEWGAEVPDDSGYWLQRYMLHVDARLSRRVRLYGELKSGIEVDRAGGPRPSDEDRLDLHHGFVDLSFGPVTMRVGRQELAFGSQRLISVREGPNIRQSFDGGTVVLQRGRRRADGFLTRYVSTETAVFDDSPDTGRSVWGVYAVRSLAQDQMKGVDLYCLGYRRTAATLDQARGREARHSLGARFWQTSSALDYNFEAVVQTGRFANATIRAWTIASDFGYRIETAPGQPRLGLRANVTSGDRDRNDNRLGTFNPPYRF
jgi:Alginate export